MAERHFQPSPISLTSLAIFSGTKMFINVWCYETLQILNVCSGEQYGSKTISENSTTNQLHISHVLIFVLYLSTSTSSYVQHNSNHFSVGNGGEVVGAPFWRHFPSCLAQLNFSLRD